jgi:hypothetical protein
MLSSGDAGQHLKPGARYSGIKTNYTEKNCTKRDRISFALFKKSD